MREIANRGPRLRRLLVLSVIAQGMLAGCVSERSHPPQCFHTTDSSQNGGDRNSFFTDKFEKFTEPFRW